MKKLALSLILSLIPLQAMAAIAFVSNTCAGSSNGGVSVTTSGITTTGANLIVLSVSYWQTNTHGTISDSKGNIWTALTAKTVSGDTSVQLYYAINPTVGTSHTFSSGAVTNSYPSVCVVAFSGAQLSSPFDVQNGAASAAVTTIATGSVKPSLNNELIVTGDGFAIVGTMSIDSSFTIPASNGQVNYSAGQHFGDAIAYIIQTSSLSTNPTWTSGGGSTSLAAAIASFFTIPSNGAFSDDF